LRLTILISVLLAALARASAADTKPPQHRVHLQR
jgi:hypothetical protein